MNTSKIDRYIQLGHHEEKLYQRFVQLIDKTNDVIDLYQPKDSNFLGNYQIDALVGNVIFAAGENGFAFSLDSFIDVLKKHKFPKLNKEKFKKKLFGEHFVNPKTLAPSKSGKDGVRSFNFFCLTPLYTLFKDCDVDKIDFKGIDGFVAEHGLPALKKAEKSKNPKDLRDFILQSWLPAAPCLLSAVVEHLLSPVEAQKYRLPVAYSGSLDDKCAKAIANC